MLEVFILALALSMDAFAVAIGLGIKNNSLNIKNLALKVALFFGFFQALMPFIGFLGGVGLNEYLGGFDKIIAFGLLLIIGAKMIYEALNESVADEIAQITNKILLTLAVATSIDAMAAGYSLRLFDLQIIFSLLIIGVTTFILSYLGVLFGKKGGEKYESYAEIFGGIVLIAIGFKILLF